jgi:hypothetical protein
LSKKKEAVGVGVAFSDADGAASSFGSSSQHMTPNVVLPENTKHKLWFFKITLDINCGSSR